MPLDMKFDPVTFDEIDDGRGSPTLTPHADTMVMHQLLCHRGECWHDDELGSDLHDLEHLQADPAVLASEDARLALEVVVRRGRIADLEITAEEVPGRVAVATRYRDVSTSDVLTLLIPGGR